MTDDSLPLVSIALATYNGESYLEPLLRSIEAQDYPHIELVIADDSSTDGTRAILTSRAYARPHRLVASSGRSGVVGNFKKALDACTGSYVAFADQDDIWEPDKISSLVARLRSMERETERPLLVFCDVEVVDADLRTIYPSFFARGFQTSQCGRLADFLIANHIPGCAMLFNRPLLDLALPFPEELFMHDWWLCMTAAAFGTISFVDRPLIKYRQHGSNVVGAAGRASSLRRKLTKVFQIAAWADWLTFMRPPPTVVAVSARNVASFEARFARDLPAAAARDLRLFRSGGRSLLDAIRFVASAHTGERALYSIAFVRMTATMGIVGANPRRES